MTFPTFLTFIPLHYNFNTKNTSMKQSSSSTFSFQYYIDLGNNKISHILITQQSDPYIEASKFCARQGLPSLLITVLGDAMRDQMQHERTLVEARKKKVTERKREKTESVVQVGMGTLNTELKEETGGNSSQIHQEQPKAGVKHQQPAERLNIFQNLYNDYKEIQKRKELSRKKSFESIPFRPQINHLSERIVLNKRKILEQMNTATTLDPKRSQQKLVPSQTAHNSRPKVTYTISGASYCQSRPQSRESIYQRTSTYLKRSEEKRRKLRESIDKKLMQGCSFKPKINNSLKYR